MSLARHFLVLIGALLLVSCAGGPPSAATHQPKLQTIQHDWQTTYLYR